MHEYRFRRRDRPQERPAGPSSGEWTSFLLSGEEKILQLISARAPLPKLLNRICRALDLDIGNVVSLISLRGEDATEAAAMAADAARFGLYAFCSAGVFAGNDELLGSLEMYCCTPGGPSLEEFQLIERATCLVAIAIERYNEVGEDANRRIHAHRALPGFVLERPSCMN